MIEWARSERPVILALALSDRKIIDRGMAKRHQAVFIEFPILVAIGAEPVRRDVAPFVGEANRDAILAKCPQLLDEAIVELARPLALQKRDDLLSAGEELRSIAPLTIGAIGLTPFGIPFVS